LGYQNALIARIDRAKDAEIDYSGIPRLDKSFLRKATTATARAPAKKQLTIRLDEDVLDWLKAHGKATRPASIAFCAW
jgi:uncharacterized protein (DUF4415 family)